MDSTNLESSLKSLFQSHQDVTVQSLLPDELNLLITSLHPSRPSSIRAQALLFLSKFASDTRQKYASQSDSDAATSILVRTLVAPIEARLADTNECDALSALSFLAALFQIDPASACAIFSRDGLLDSVIETPDLYPTSSGIPQAVASLLAQASGHKSCRPLVASPQVTAWLTKGAGSVTETTLRAAAAVALVKLSQGSDSDSQGSSVGELTTASSTQSSQVRNSGTSDTLVTLMKDLVVTGEHPSSSTLNAVEGLAYLTIQSPVKETVSSDPVFLKRLFTLVPRRPSAPSFPTSHTKRGEKPQALPEHDLGLSYGIATIITNLSSYKPLLSEEERQIERLRRMASRPTTREKLSDNAGDTSTDLDKLDDDDHVRNRGRKLMEAGVIDALSSIVRGLGGDMEKRSPAIHRTVSRAFLSLAEEKVNRGKILQGGGSKALLTIIRASLRELVLSSSDNGSQKGIENLDPSDLLAIQALAKLAITASPAAVFGPAQGSYVDAIRPFAILLAHSAASLLQRFEAIMALTNIASISSEAADRISGFKFMPKISQTGQNSIGDIVKRAETSLLDGNTMLRRAATELVCNLVGGAEDSFDYFGGKPRLQILVALSDVEDLPTRLAASGSLATLTASPDACHALVQLEMERHRLLPVMVELIAPDIAREYREERPEDDQEDVPSSTGDPGLVHRGVVCVRNVFANLSAKEERKSMSLEAEKRGLARALVQVIKSSSDGPADGAVLKPTADVLKWMIEAGVKLAI